ncbi:antibiotic biosynthesis monooxygenase [Archangium minus]|uniref:Antibiotic biosynthesis monooxygenase n=1 Tax=Archangium minus TaxID=83450 RepID=A0ABY9WZ28_9BACT|nr:antibiotic biosynthesis monooxygenase [Archangium minus]
MDRGMNFQAPRIPKHPALRSPEPLSARLPPIQRPDVGLVLSSRWTVPTREAQQAAANAAMDAWEHVPWPEGLLSYSCLLGEDGTTVTHYSQWTGDEALQLFRRNDPPERVQGILAAVPGIERHGVVTYRPFRAFVGEGPSEPPGCIVTVDITFEGPDPERQQRWVEAVLEAAATGSRSQSGLLAAHFHLSTDGTRVLNLAEWTDASAHRAFLESASPQWHRVLHFPGLKDNGATGTPSWAQARQHRPYRGLFLPPSTT